MPSLRDLNDAYDLLEKARYELAELNSREHPYKLFNLLCILEHVNDWVEKDQPHLKKKREAIHTGSVANSVRVLCNRVKHFRKASTPDAETKITYFTDGTIFTDSAGFFDGYYVLDDSGQK